jgi:hypothetical protein
VLKQCISLGNRTSPFGTDFVNSITVSMYIVSFLKPVKSDRLQVKCLAQLEGGTNGFKEVEVEVKLRPTISRPVFLPVGLPSGAHDQIFVFCLTIAGFLPWGALSDERMCM